MDFIMNLGQLSNVIDIIKTFFLCFGIYYLNFRIIDEKIEINSINIFIKIIVIFIIAVCSTIIKYTVDYMYSIIFLVFSLSLISKKENFMYSIFITTISMSINYIGLSIGIFLSFFPNYFINIKNDYINLFIIILIYFLFILYFIKVKKFRRGFEFLKSSFKNEYIQMVILNISIIIIFFIILSSNYNVKIINNLVLSLKIFMVIMFITIQKSLELYYKQKLQQREFEELKEEIKQKDEEIKQLEAENLKFSKTSHSIAHKQKALEYKLEQILLKNEIADEIDIRNKLNQIKEDIVNNDTNIELDKTKITEIDDMLEYMKSECVKNKIDFELKIKGNIYHMINKYIEKENLEILIADHIKNAIIAINHSDNVNKSILVKIGLIDGEYGIHVYDSGIEFEIDTLIKLGKTPSTTHANEGGTGMGFMNTFETLEKFNASMIIKEIGKPTKENYTKCLSIKFDNKNEYKIISYRTDEIKKKLKNSSRQILIEKI